MSAPFTRRAQPVLASQSGAKRHGGEGKEQQVVIPKNERRQETQKCERGPRVQGPIKHERNSL
jgi:hypothetical protein